MPPIQPVNRIFYADVLRVIAIIAVIILHNASDYVPEYGKIPLSYWWAGAIYNGLARFCVPMFVILSGAFLLKKNKEVTIQEVFSKRIPKILIPLIFWSIVYVVYENSMMEDGWKNFHLWDTLSTFYQGPVIYHFWFLYMLIGVYLIYPILNVFISAAKEIHIRYFLIMWIITNTFFGLIETMYGLSIGIELNSFTGYAGYFLLGYYLTNFTFTTKQLNVFYFLAVLSLIFSTIMPYLLIKCQVAHASEITESDFTPDIILAVMGLYLWMKNRSFRAVPSSLSYKIIGLISMESFGIYLIHVLIMEYAFTDDKPYSEFFSNLHPVWGIPLKAGVILVTSFLIVRAIRYIPVLKKVIG